MGMAYDEENSVERDDRDVERLDREEAFFFCIKDNAPGTQGTGFPDSVMITSVILQVSCTDIAVSSFAEITAQFSPDLGANYQDIGTIRVDAQAGDSNSNSIVIPIDNFITLKNFVLGATYDGAGDFFVSASFIGYRLL